MAGNLSWRQCGCEAPRLQWRSLHLTTKVVAMPSVLRGQVVILTGAAQQPNDLNGIVAFLLSEDSAFIAGQAFDVDGGALFH